MVYWLIASERCSKGKIHVSIPLIWSLNTIPYLQMSSDYMELEKAEIPSDKVAMIEEFERRKRVRAITVSTNDSEVSVPCGPIRGRGFLSI